jgi:hypothetical protein
LTLEQRTSTTAPYARAHIHGETVREDVAEGGTHEIARAVRYYVLGKITRGFSDGSMHCPSAHANDAAACFFLFLLGPIWS